MKNLYFSSSIRGMKEKSTRKNTVLLRSMRRKTVIEMERGTKYGRLLVQRDNEEDAFVITLACPKCSTAEHSHLTALKSVKGKPFHYGIHVDENDRIIHTVKCEWCTCDIELTESEAKLLGLKFDEFKAWYAEATKTPEWDGTWTRQGLKEEK
jgi:hypothetical protein